MRAVVILFFFAIISLCNRFGRSEDQTDTENSKSKATFGTGIKAKPINSIGGQREYYIPSYSSPQLQRPQDFIYPQNYWNAYQYSQYKHTNRVPDNVNQRHWSSTPSLGNPIHSNYRLRGSTVVDRNVDSVNNDYIPTNNAFQYKTSEKFNLKPNNVENESSKHKSKVTESLENKIKDFDGEQERLSEVDAIRTGADYKDLNNNKLSDFMFGPVMRRKSTSNDKPMHTSALQGSEQRSIPVPLARQQSSIDSGNGGLGDIYFVAIVACVSAVAIFGVIGAGICVYKVQQSNKAAADVDYPAYGVVGPASKEANSNGNTSPSGDRKLAQSAQMYHYHHQKQQMIASEKAVTNRRNSASDVESDEENEEGEYTVYECPGLAPTGEMEVKNPLFHDDITPVSSPPVNGNTKEK